MAKRQLNVKLRRESGEVKRYRFLTKFVGAGIVAIALFLILVYIITLFYTSSGAFTVSVMKFGNAKYSLILSETPDFENHAVRLNCKAAKDVTNISIDSIPKDVDAINGQHNGENYIAYTYYCKNNGKVSLDYSYELYITNITKKLDKAVRVKLFVDGKEKTFARVAGDGSPEPNTTPFQTANTIVKKNVYNFKPKEVTKFTVVIWIEGNDPDCVDDKLGGEFKVDMAINVLGLDEKQKK